MVHNTFEQTENQIYYLSEDKEWISHPSHMGEGFFMADDDDGKALHKQLEQRTGL